MNRGQAPLFRLFLKLRAQDYGLGNLPPKTAQVDRAAVRNSDITHGK